MSEKELQHLIHILQKKKPKNECFIRRKKETHFTKNRITKVTKNRTRKGKTSST